MHNTGRAEAHLHRSEQQTQLLRRDLIRNPEGVFAKRVEFNKRLYGRAPSYFPMKKSEAESLRRSGFRCQGPLVGDLFVGEWVKGSGATAGSCWMLRTYAEQVSLWEAVLPDEVRRLPVEVERVDRLLDDEVFFGPFVPFFHPTAGRPSTPIETYLRLMFLKFRHGLGYESLCREVADSITWRRFCRIPLDGKVPHPTTLMKLTTRCGTAAIDGLNEALLAKAVQAKVLRTDRLQADTTVVPANVAYPTDSGLLAKAIKRIAVTGRRIQAAGGAVRTAVRDRSRSAGKRAHGIAAKLRMRSAQGRDEAQAVVKRITGELADLAGTAAKDAEKVLVNARRALRRAQVKAQKLAAAGRADPVAGRRRGRLHRAVNDLAELLNATRKIAAQTRLRVAGTTPPGASRQVNLHDPDARPIAKGRLGKPVELTKAATRTSISSPGRPSPIWWWCRSARPAPST